MKQERHGPLFSHTSIRRASALGLTAAVLFLTACSGAAAKSGAASGSAGAKTVVGFSAGVLDNPFTAGLVKSVVDQARTGGFDMLPPTNANGDPAKQITDFQTLISQGVKGLVFIPRDSDAIIPGVKAANAAGIPVITVDTAANGGDVYMQIRADNVAMGASVCQEIGRLTGGTGTVLELFGTLSTTSGFDRHKGFNDCMVKNFPQVKLISKDTSWETAKAANVAQTVVSTNTINAVFMASDSVMLPGVQTVMKALGKWNPTGKSGHISIVTIDGSAGSLQAIRDGYVDAVISQPVNLYGKYGIMYLKDALAGKKYSVGPSDHGSEIVTYKGNLADMLPSPVVTTKNVDDASLWGNAK